MKTLIWSACAAFVVVVAVACNPFQLRGAAETSRSVAPMAPPPFNEMIVQGAGEVDSRLDDLEAWRAATGTPVDENMSMEEWLYLIFKIGAPTAAASVVTTNVMRSKSRNSTVLGLEGRLAKLEGKNGV